MQGEERGAGEGLPRRAAGGGHARMAVGLRVRGLSQAWQRRARSLVRMSRARRLAAGYATGRRGWGGGGEREVCAPSPRLPARASNIPAVPPRPLPPTRPTHAQTHASLLRNFAAMLTRADAAALAKAPVAGAQHLRVRSDGERSRPKPREPAKCRQEASEKQVRERPAAGTRAVGALAPQKGRECARGHP